MAKKKSKGKSKPYVSKSQLLKSLPKAVPLAPKAEPKKITIKRKPKAAPAKAAPAKAAPAKATV